MSKRKDAITIEVWPQLRAALGHQRFAMLGDTPEEVAKFLIVEALDRRLQDIARNDAAWHNARAAGLIVR